MQSKIERVMLIDDDEVNNELNQIVLKQFGYEGEAVVFENAKEALNYLKENCNPSLPQFILLDIKMPVMDGFQFLEEAEKMCEHFTKKIPVFLLTSSKSDRDIKKANEYEISGYINKPLTVSALEKIFDDCNSKV